MKLMRMQGDVTGLVLEGRSSSNVLDVVASLSAFRRFNRKGADALGALLPQGDASWLGLIAYWDSARSILEEMSEACVADDKASGWHTSPVESTASRPPFPSPASRVFSAGSNFADHYARALTSMTGKTVTEEDILSDHVGASPEGFHVLREVVVGEGAYVAPPPSTQFFDYEGEVAAVLATGGRDIPANEVDFWAVAPWMDYSNRDLIFKRADFERGAMNWTLRKNFEHGKGFGPWLGSLDGRSVQDLDFHCRINGDLRQSSNTGRMIWPFAALAAHISHFIELRPGDVFISGCPAGTALEEGEGGPFLRPGDQVQCSIDGVGTLTNWIGTW